jgi:hypothetical protein
VLDSLAEIEGKDSVEDTTVDGVVRDDNVETKAGVVLEVKS